MDLYNLVVAAKLTKGGGGGGSSNVVTGEFTTNAAYGVQEITIPYSGNGYPISVCIMSKSPLVGQATNVVPTGAISVQKKVTTVAPKYNEASDDEADMYELYRYTSSTGTRFTFANVLGSSAFFSQNNPTQADWTKVRMSAPDKLNVFTTGNNENRKGLLSNATYVYIIEYSS